MIYLIAGSPRIGKTTIAKQLAQNIHAQLVSTDELENPHPAPSVIFYDDPQKNILTPHARIESVVSEAKQISSKIDDIVNKAIQNQQDTVIEGVHLLPSYVANLLKKFGKEKIQAILIGSRDVIIILSGMAQNTSPNNWLKDSNQEVLKQVALFTKIFSDYLYEESKKYNLVYQERSNDFQKDTLMVINELSK